MKKILRIAFGILILCTFVNMQTFAETAKVSAYKANIKSKRLETGVILELKLLDPVSTTESNEGDMFTAMLKNDKKDNSQIILPSGTLFRGTIKKITPNKRLSQGAVLYVVLDHVVTPTGKQIPISAGICGNYVMTVDGGIKAGGNYGYAIQKNWDKMSNIIGKSLTIGSDVGDKALDGYLKVITIPAGGVIGVGAGSLYFVGNSFVDLFRKGENVILNQDDTINFVLISPIDIPVN